MKRNQVNRVNVINLQAALGTQKLKDSAHKLQYIIFTFFIYLHNSLHTSRVSIILKEQPTPKLDMVPWWPLHWKKSSAKIKICWHPQTRLNKLSLSYHSNGVGHLKQCFYFFIVRKGFMSRSRAKRAFFEGSKTALTKFEKSFHP